MSEQAIEEQLAEKTATIQIMLDQIHDLSGDLGKARNELFLTRRDMRRSIEALGAAERGWQESGAALADSLLERARLVAAGNQMAEQMEHAPNCRVRWSGRGYGACNCQRRVLVAAWRAAVGGEGAGE